MSEVVISYKDNGTQKILENFAKRSEHMEAFKSLIIPLAMKDIDQHFKESQGPSGKWPKRAAFTEMAYGMQGKSGRGLLLVTGALRNSIIARGYNQGVKLTANSKYANIHNEGGTITAKKQWLYLPISKKASQKRTGAPIDKKLKRGKDYIFTKSVKIPQREFMWLSDKGHEGIAKKILDYITGDVK